MKTEIHPKYLSATGIECANCGHKFPIGSTKEGIRVEICSKCHPFYTGKKMLIDTEGRVDKFRQKMAGAAGRDPKEKKVRKKKTLEDKVNEELSAQMMKEKAKEEKAKEAKVAKKAAAAEASLEA